MPAALEDAPEVEPEPDIEDVFDELEALEEVVDTAAEREQVRATMRTLQRARRPRLGRLRDTFDSRDVGESLVGSFLFGIPMIVEDGTLAAGSYVSTRPAFAAVTLLFGLGLIGGILHAAEVERIEEDLLFGVVPIRLVSIAVVAVGMAVGLLTVWGRVDWATPLVAGGQTMVTAIVMAVGASLGDVLPGT